MADSPRARRRALFARIRECVVPVVRLLDDALRARVPVPAAAGSAFIEIVGTATVIARPGGLELQGIAVTADHVMEAFLDENGRSDPNRVPSILWPLVPNERRPDGTPHAVACPVTRLERNPALDLAAVFFAPPDQLAADEKLAPLAGLPSSRDACADGDDVVVCGFPFGSWLHEWHEDIHGSPTFSRGIVSAALPYPGAPLSRRDHFRLDAMVNQGQSGGPVVDVETGELIGIVIDMIAPPSRAAADAPGASAAVSISGVSTTTSPRAARLAPPGAPVLAAVMRDAPEFDRPMGIARAVYGHHVGPLCGKLRQAARARKRGQR